MCKAILAKGAAVLGLCAGLAVMAPAGPPPAKMPALVDAAGLRKQIAAHKGRVVVVNLWATWCSPCKAEFPDLVKVQKADRAKGLDLLTLAFDDPKDSAKVTAFLAQNRLTTGTFANKSGTNLDDAYIKFFEPKMPASEAYALPRTYIFDRAGKLVKSFAIPLTFAKLQAAVTPYLSRR